MNRPSRAVCRHWKRGACNRGDKCSFLHPENSFQPPTQGVHVTPTPTPGFAPIDVPIPRPSPPKSQLPQPAPVPGRPENYQVLQQSHKDPPPNKNLPDPTEQARLVAEQRAQEIRKIPPVGPSSNTVPGEPLLQIINRHKEALINSILKAALDTEALYTIFTGNPIVSHFEWTPTPEDRGRLSQIVGEDRHDQKSWIADLLESAKILPTTFLPWYSSPIPNPNPCLHRGPSEPELPEGCNSWFETPLFRLLVPHPIKSPFWGYEKPELSFTVYCINIEMLHKRDFNALTKCFEFPWRQLDYFVPEYFRGHGLLTSDSKRPDWTLHRFCQLVNGELPRPNGVPSYLPSTQLEDPGYIYTWGGLPYRSKNPFCYVRYPCLPCYRYPRDPWSVGLRASDIVISTPTVTGIAPTGWIHPNYETELLTEEEIGTIQDRDLIVKLYKHYSTKYDRLSLMLKDLMSDGGYSWDYSTFAPLAKFRGNKNFDGLTIKVQNKLLVDPWNALPNKPTLESKLYRLFWSRRQVPTLDIRAKFDKEIEDCWTSLSFHLSQKWSAGKDLELTLDQEAIPGIELIHSRHTAVSKIRKARGYSGAVESIPQKLLISSLILCRTDPAEFFGNCVSFFDPANDDESEDSQEDLLLCRNPIKDLYAKASKDWEAQSLGAMLIEAFQQMYCGELSMWDGPHYSDYELERLPNCAWVTMRNYYQSH